MSLFRVRTPRSKGAAIKAKAKAKARAKAGDEGDHEGWAHAWRGFAVLSLDAGIGLVAAWTLLRAVLAGGSPVVWVNLSVLPPLLAELVLWFFTVGVLAWTLLPDSLRFALRVSAALLALVCVADTWVFHQLVSSGRLHAAAACSLSLPTAVLLALWAGWAASPRRRPPRRAMIRRAVLALALIPVAAALFVFSFGQSDYRRPADAAVVFGAAVYQDGSASLSLEDRTRTACRLFLDGVVDSLVLSGGHGEGMRYSEPQVMRSIALQMGVPDQAIILDVQGHNTYATVHNTANFAQHLGWHSVLMVSHDYHLARIKMFAKHAGLRSYTVPAEESRPLKKKRRFFLRELAAIVWYAVHPEGEPPKRGT